MVENGLILYVSHIPTYEEIDEYMDLPAQELWRQINHFIQLRYKTSPKIMHSTCTAKPFNGTLWLMLQVKDNSQLNDVKQLLLLKHETRKVPADTAAPVI